VLPGSKKLCGPYPEMRCCVYSNSENPEPGDIDTFCDQSNIQPDVLSFENQSCHSKSQPMTHELPCYGFLKDLSANYHQIIAFRSRSIRTNRLAWALTRTFSQEFREASTE